MEVAVVESAVRTGTATVNNNRNVTPHHKPYLEPNVIADRLLLKTPVPALLTAAT